jgi:hypothetical protein
MNRYEFASKHPTLYHVSKSDWPNLLETGLRSTRVLVTDLQDETGKVLVSRDEGSRFNLEFADSILGSHRPNDWIIRQPDAQEKQVRLRNQRPLKPNRLKYALTDGMQPYDWIRTLNEHVFLFPGNPMENAFVKNEVGKQTVLALNTSKLLDAFGQEFYTQWKFAKINLGSTIHRPAPRGRGSMKSSFGDSSRNPIREVLVQSTIEASALRRSLEYIFIVRDGQYNRIRR